MIYLDNAATTFPKPDIVVESVSRALKKYGANPGRAGHSMSMYASQLVYNCREKATEFFEADNPECVIFTSNCTQSLNYAIKGLITNKGNVVISDLEHNAVARPLNSLEERGIITVTRAHVVIGDNDKTVENFRKAITSDTCLAVCTHASNVFGISLPVKRLSALFSEYKIPFCVDCAQTAGIAPISMKDGYTCICMPGHKGLYGPMGTGLLIVKKGVKFNTIIEGGTGTESASLKQPELLPERLESGTVNFPGIVGLNSGIEFVHNKGIERIRQHEEYLMNYLYQNLKNMDNIVIYTPPIKYPYLLPVLSFNVKEKPSQETAEQLNKYGIAVRAGLHCAPLAHQTMKTFPNGTVRMCPSVFTEKNNITAVINVINKIQKNNNSV